MKYKPEPKLVNYEPESDDYYENSIKAEVLEGDSIAEF